MDKKIRKRQNFFRDEYEKKFNGVKQNLKNQCFVQCSFCNCDINLESIRKAIIPFTSLFGKNENQFGTNEIQFGTNENQCGTNENQCGTNEIQYGRNEIQIDINETISCFLLAIFIFWHNLKKFSFLNSYNKHVYSFII